MGTTESTGGPLSPGHGGRLPKGCRLSALAKQLEQSFSLTRQRPKRTRSCQRLLYPTCHTGAIMSIFGAESRAKVDNRPKHGHKEKSSSGETTPHIDPSFCNRASPQSEPPSDFRVRSRKWSAVSPSVPLFRVKAAMHPRNLQQRSAQERGAA